MSYTTTFFSRVIFVLLVLVMLNFWIVHTSIVSLYDKQYPGSQVDFLCGASVAVASSGVFFSCPDAPSPDGYSRGGILFERKSGSNPTLVKRGFSGRVRGLGLGKHVSVFGDGTTVVMSNPDLNLVVALSDEFSHTLSAPDAGLHAAFGASTAIGNAGRTIVVGAPGTSYGGVLQAGAIFVFVFDEMQGEWNLEAHMNVSDPTVLGRFGTSVDVNDDASAILGGGDGIDYALYFRRSPNASVWSLYHTLQPIGTGLSVFSGGVSLSANGSIAVVGAARENTHGDQSGSVHVFVVDEIGGWNATQKLITSVGSPNALCGSSLDMTPDGGSVAVGCPGYEPVSDDIGAVFVFDAIAPGIFNESAMLLPESHLDVSVGMGTSVAMGADGEELLCGGPRLAANGTVSVGAAFHFRKNASGMGEWGLVEQLTAPPFLLNPVVGEDPPVEVAREMVAIGYPLLTLGFARTFSQSTILGTIY